MLRFWLMECLFSVNDHTEARSIRRRWRIFNSGGVLIMNTPLPARAARPSCTVPYETLLANKVDFSAPDPRLKSQDRLAMAFAVIIMGFLFIQTRAIYSRLNVGGGPEGGGGRGGDFGGGGMRGGGPATTVRPCKINHVFKSPGLILETNVRHSACNCWLKSHPAPHLIFEIEFDKLHLIVYFILNLRLYTTE